MDGPMRCSTQVLLLYFMFKCVRTLGSTKNVTGIRKCGFDVPGSSPLWSHHAEHMHQDGRQFVWDWGGSEADSPGGVATLHRLEDALKLLDANKTTILEVHKGDTQRARTLRGYMVPFVQRGCIDSLQQQQPSTWVGPGAMNSTIGVLRSTPPPSRGLPCFLEKYYSPGLPPNTTLEGYLKRPRGVNAPHPGVNSPRDSACHPYWVSCVEVGDVALPREWGWVSSLLTRDHTSRWGEARQSRVCLRAARGETRLPFHIDEWGNTLYALKGLRRVLLSPPQLAEGFYPSKTTGGGGHATTSPIDPRASDILSTHPLTRELWMLVVTLYPGDSLYIPVAWWHYVEASPVHVNAPVSMGVNVFEMEDAGFRRHQCVATHPLGNIV